MEALNGEQKPRQEPVTQPPKAGPDGKPIPVIALLVEVLSDTGEREKKVSLAEALREVGMDERACARLMAKMVEDLLERRKPDGSEKLRADLVWEIVRLLEPSGSGGDDAESGIPVQMAFVHTVPRPSRGNNDDAENLSWD
jgi:hypothetical protein